jgi:hypothetical protein
VPLPLQRDALDVRTPGDRHAAVQVAKLGDIDLLRPAVEAGVVDPFAVGRQQLGELVGVLRERGLCDQGVHRRHPFGARPRLRGPRHFRTPAPSPTGSRVRPTRTSLKHSKRA